MIKNFSNKEENPYQQTKHNSRFRHFFSGNQYQNFSKTHKKSARTTITLRVGKFATAGVAAPGSMPTKYAVSSPCSRRRQAELRHWCCKVAVVVGCVVTGVWPKVYCCLVGRFTHNDDEQLCLTHRDRLTHKHTHSHCTHAHTHNTNIKRLHTYIL